MLDQFFALGDMHIFLGFALTYICSGLLIYWAFIILTSFDVVSSVAAIPATLIIPTHLFALSSAFLGVAVWDSFSNHFDAVSREGDALIAYVNYVDSIPSLKKSNLIPTAKSYAESASSKEWQMIATERHGDPQTDMLLKDLISSSLQAASNPSLSNAISAGLVQAAQNINVARNARLGMIYNGRPHALQWYCVLLLGFMVQVSVLATHANKPSQSKSILIIVTISILIVLTLIGLCVNPYIGSISVSQYPLQEILSHQISQ